MSPKQATAFRIAPEIMKALRAVRERDGLPISRQVDFALRAWLKRRGIRTTVKADHRRA